MKDRFKFRWICNSTKFAYDVVLFDLDNNYAQVIIKDDEYMTPEEVKISDGQLIQCTGLKDKNNDLIYEHDYITVNGKNKRMVIWDNEEFKFVSIYDNGEKAGFIYNNSSSKLEIIGNIHEEDK